MSEYLMVIADLHYDQTRDTITDSLEPLLRLSRELDEPVTNWLGLGDIVNNSNDSYGPFEDNITELENVFDDWGITFKTVVGNHDTDGYQDEYGDSKIYDYGSSIFPDRMWTWNIGETWRILAVESRTSPTFTVTDTAKTWLAGQLAQASTDGRYVIVITHQRLDDGTGYNYVTNSADVRAILEAADDPPKLVLCGHVHTNASSDINGIPYRIFESCAPWNNGNEHAGGLLHLNDDGTWQIQGFGGQASYNWHEFHVDGSVGLDTNSGAASVDPVKTLSALPSIQAGDTLNISGGPSGKIDFDGETGSPVVISGGGSVSAVDGSYLEAENLTILPGGTISADDTTIKRVK